MDYLEVGAFMTIAIWVIIMLLWKIAEKVIEFERR